MSTVYQSYFRASSSFTRPSNTTSYALGQLVADNTVGSSITPLTFTINSSDNSHHLIRRALLVKSTSGTVSAVFRLHLFSALPAVSASANGDGASLTLNAASIAAYIGYIDSLSATIQGSASAAGGAFAAWSAPVAGAEPIVPKNISTTPGVGSVVYGLLEARLAYGPGSAEQFSVTIEAYPQ